MARARQTSTALCGALAALALLPASVPSARAESMVVQPDGRIVLTGRVEPSFAALARLGPDGAPDPSFGQGGFVIDRRLPPLKALALEPDGRIVAAGVEGFQLARYLPDGTPDPTFAAGGVGGTVDPSQKSFLYSDYGPESILLQPGGEILVGGTQELSVGRWTTPAVIVRRYDSSGVFSGTAGAIPPVGFPAGFESHLAGLVPGPGGAAIGAGSIYDHNREGQQPSVLLARFPPGSGSEYDPSFGGGRGVVMQAFPGGRFDTVSGNAIVRHGDGLLVAGGANATFLLARFDGEGNLDPGFGGGGGFVSPPIVGTSGVVGDSRAEALAVDEGGRIVLAGATSRWGRWGSGRFHAYECVEKCSQPLLALFTAGGELDPSFGSGGVLRLLDPGGEPIEGRAEEVATLPGGKILVKGTITEGLYESAVSPFLARLNPDGGYDRSFGEDGLVTPSFPCWGKGAAALRREGCLPSAAVKLRVGGVAGGRPWLSLRVLKPSVPWAQIGEVRLHLPKVLRPSSRLRARARVVGFDGARARRFLASDPVVTKGGLSFKGLALSRALKVTLSPGALGIAGGRSGRRALEFHVRVVFVHDNPLRRAGLHEVVLRRRGG